LEISPGDADVWYNIGLSQGQLEHHNEAINAFRNSLKLNRKDADVWFNLGLAYGKIGDQNEKARDAFRKAFSNDPENQELIYNIGMAHAWLLS
jgi:superkiller protein 3